jgi:hypothetical protein
MPKRAKKRRGKRIWFECSELVAAGMKRRQVTYKYSRLEHDSQKVVDSRELDCFADARTPTIVFYPISRLQLALGART